MSIELSAEESALQQAVRQFLATRLAPSVPEFEREKRFPWELLRELYGFGYVTGVVAAEHGGDETSTMIQAILMEEAGRCWGSLRTSVNVLSMVARMLARHADRDQRETFLHPLLKGDRFGFFAATESEAGSDIAAIRCTAREDGGDFVIDGSKIFITNAHHADFGIVLARHLDATGESLGVSAFLVEHGSTGLDIHDMPHLPVRGTTNCEIVLRGVRVPKCNLLGAAGSGLAAAMSAVNIGRLNIAMGAVGISQACLEASVQHVRQRQQFGKPLAAFQLVQKMVVDIAVATQTARLLGYHAARTRDRGGDARYEISMAKLYCAESANTSASLALQLFGGSGLMEESPVERYFRDAREATIPEGTSQIQTLLLGKEILGVAAFG